YLHLAHVLREQKIDLVYDRTYLATLDAAGGCLFRPTPRISCCVVDPKPELEFHARISKNLSWWFARRAYSSATLVLANSEGLRKRLIEYFRLSPDHVRVSYNMLSAASLDASIPDTDPAVAMPDEKFLIVTAGRLHAQKGHRYLLEAVDEL